MDDIAVLDVLLYGERIGTVTRLPGDRTLFAFTEAHIANRDRATLSLSCKDAWAISSRMFAPPKQDYPCSLQALEELVSHVLRPPQGSARARL